MHLLIPLLLILSACATSGEALGNAELQPITLKDWPAETFQLPPGFAPTLPQGTESLRFAPGWRDPKSDQFWSYTFVMWVNESIPNAERLDWILEQYYVGLMGAFARNHKEKVRRNPAQVAVVSTARNQYEATMRLIDAFATFELINIRLVIDTIAESPKRSLIRVRLSRQPKSHKVWQDLEIALQSIKTPKNPFGPPPSLDATNDSDLEQQTTQAHKKLWRNTTNAIAVAPRYSGLQLKPQRGLLPLGIDPSSKLHEFLHLPTHQGTIPIRDKQGRIHITEDTGLIFILIPSGKFWMGSQSTNPKGQNFDPQSQDNETLHEVHITSPYFISKYEMTQGQWGRSPTTLKNPSEFRPNPGTVASAAPPKVNLRHPVEQVPWKIAKATLERMDLALPTDEQWEYAARAGTTSPWVGNVTTKENIPAWGRIAPLSANDKHTTHAPVGQFRANAFGLHDVLGNVWEWTASLRTNRGGGYLSNPFFSRVAYSGGRSENARNNALGLRPSREVSSN